jgi:hypothetical protein
MPSIEGICFDFCPRDEALQRASSGGVSALEDVTPGSEWPIVKWYSRSAAGVTVSACDVRPAGVLVRVVEHLLSKVVSRKGWRVAASFVTDRLRSTRVDAYIQELAGGMWARALVAQLRFHAALSFALLAGGGESGKEEAAFLLRENSVRASEAGDDAWTALLTEAKSEARHKAVQSDGVSALALILEVQTLRLALAVASSPSASASAGMSVTQLLAAAAHLARAAMRTDGDAREAAALYLATVKAAAAWSSCRWKDFLARASSLPSGQCQRNIRAANLARCVLSRCFPHARCELIRAFNDAVPARLTFPASALASLLHVSQEDNSGCGHTAHFRAARYSVQLGIGLREPDGARSDNALAMLDNNRESVEFLLVFDKNIAVKSSTGDVPAADDVESGDADLPLMCL